MKELKKYLNTKSADKSVFNKELDKVYIDIYDLVRDLNIFFRDRLKKPIKVIDTSVVFRPLNPYQVSRHSYGASGIHVKEHFVIEFNDVESKVRGGIFDKTLLMQKIYAKDYRGKLSYGYMTRFNPYKFDISFKEYLISLINKEHFGHYIDLVKMFQIEDINNLIYK